MSASTTPKVAAPGASSASASAEPARLRGNLGVVGLVFTVLAFNAPLAVMAGFVPVVIAFGNGIGAPMAFVAIGVLLTLFAVGLTTMSKFMRSPGAFYSYIVAGIGRPLGLGSAFLAFISYLAIASCSYAFGGILVDALVQGVLNGPAVDWWVWSLLLWVVTAGFTLLDIDLSAKVLGVLMCGEVIVVIVWVLAVGVDGGPIGISVESFNPSVFLSGSISFGLLFALLSSLGFEAVAVFREETRDPVKTVPRATYLSVILLTGFYAIGAWAYITAFGPDKALTESAADPSGSFTASIGQYVGTIAVDIVSVLLVTSAFAALLATQNIAARYIYTLGSDAVLPRALGKVHPRFGSPYIAAVVVAVLTLLGFGIPTILGADPLKLYAGLAGLGAVGIVFLMTATNVAIVLFFRRNPEHNPGAFKGLIAPVLAFLGLGTILVLAVKNMAVVVGGTQNLANVCTAFLVVVIAAGIGLALYYRQSRPAVYARIGRQDL